MTNSQLIGVGTDTLMNLHVAELKGGAGPNVFTVSGWTGRGSLDGQGGTDQIVAIRDTDQTRFFARLGKTRLTSTPSA